MIKSLCGWMLGVQVVAHAATGFAASAQDPFAACSEQFARKPDNYDSAYCFYEVAQQKSVFGRGRRRSSSG